MRKLEEWRAFSFSFLLFFSCWCSFLFYFYSSVAFLSSFCCLTHVQSCFLSLYFAFFPLSSFKRKSSLLSGGKGQVRGRAWSKNRGIGDVLVLQLGWLALPSTYIQQQTTCPHCCCHSLIHPRLLPTLLCQLSNPSFSSYFSPSMLKTSTIGTLLKVKSLLFSTLQWFQNKFGFLRVVH